MRVYLGSIDDRVLKYPFGDKPEYLRSILLRALLFGHPFYVHEGALIQRDDFRSSLSEDGCQLITRLARAGYCRILSREQDLSAIADGQRSMTRSMEEVIPSLSCLKDKLKAFSADIRSAAAFDEFPGQHVAATDLLIRGPSVSRYPFSHFGFRSITQEQFGELMVIYNTRREQGETPRSAFESAVRDFLRRAHLQPVPHSSFYTEAMRFANRSYHLAHAGCLAAREPADPVGVETGFAHYYGGITALPQRPAFKRRDSDNRKYSPILVDLPALITNIEIVAEELSSPGTDLHMLKSTYLNSLSGMIATDPEEHAEICRTYEDTLSGLIGGRRFGRGNQIDPVDLANGAGVIIGASVACATVAAEAAAATSAMPRRAAFGVIRSVFLAGSAAAAAAMQIPDGVRSIQQSHALSDGTGWDQPLGLDEANALVDRAGQERFLSDHAANIAVPVMSTPINLTGVKTQILDRL